MPSIPCFHALPTVASNVLISLSLHTHSRSRLMVSAASSHRPCQPTHRYTHIETHGHTQTNKMPSYTQECIHRAAVVTKHDGAGMQVRVWCACEFRVSCSLWQTEQCVWQASLKYCAHQRLAAHATKARQSSSAGTGYASRLTVYLC